MSVLYATAAERKAVEAQFEKMILANALPGGVRLGTPIEDEDGNCCWVDSRWDAPVPGKAIGAVADCLATMQKDAKVAVTTATKVLTAVPVTFKPKVEVAPKDEIPTGEKLPVEKV